MALVPALYFCLGAVISLFLAFFGVTLAQEKKPRATLCAAVLWFGFSAGWGFLYLATRGHVYVALGTVALAVLFLIFFFAPYGRRRQLLIGPGGERIDERDTVFARFDLQPGSKRYDAYYADRPGPRCPAATINCCFPPSPTRPAWGSRADSVTRSHPVGADEFGWEPLRRTCR